MDRPLCACGCGEPVTLAKQTHSYRGEVRGEPHRFIRGHHNKLNRRSYAVDEATGCWNWQGSLNPDGYPNRIKGAGKRVQAHRFFYERQHGPIPPGLQLDHRCRNRRCVNPEHMEPVTPAVNTRRQPQTKLTESDITEIQRLRAEGLLHREIAQRFGIDSSYVSMILSGKKWRERHAS